MNRGSIDWSDVDDEALFRLVAASENLASVETVMNQLTVDHNWTEVVLELVRNGKLETRCFIRWLAETLKPETYLEIGVRRGFSMSMVASAVQDVQIYGFDMWLKGYAGSENPGPDYVRSELAGIGYTGSPVFLSGNSHQTLPAFFSDPSSGWLRRRRMDRLAPGRPELLDLMLVDGDHSLLGAYQDLMDTLPHLSVGGVLVFDDITPDPSYVDSVETKNEAGDDPHGWMDLLGVWRHAIVQFPSYRSIEYATNTPGVALAVRLA
ncbi:MAG: hypothetical protein CVT67_01730 [Actinobacteria bacterium HGW-Actinobacteria-7]|nr:MAG: hypothetical protein CVT67_01730 [Actinobacteria bacterium HGW-Actinobacteria-7]